MKQENQKEIEWMYSKKRIRKYILQELSSHEVLSQKAEDCVALIQHWAGQSYYASKQARVDEFMAKKGNDLLSVVYTIFGVVLQKKKEEPLPTVVGELAGALGMAQPIDGAKLAAELLTVCCEADVWDLNQADEVDAVIYVEPKFPLSEKLRNFIKQTQYLPPMICPPRIVRSNHDSGYFTIRESMILGKGNYHTGEIGLDSINKFNQVPLTLNEALLTTLSERPKNKFKDMEQREQWLKFVKDSYRVYRELIQQGNEMWLTHRVDKRGRTYAQGYHVSTQGNSFRKAMIQFAEPEIVEGV